MVAQITLMNFLVRRPGIPMGSLVDTLLLESALLPVGLSLLEAGLVSQR